MHASARPYVIAGSAALLTSGVIAVTPAMSPAAPRVANMDVRLVDSGSLLTDLTGALGNLDPLTSLGSLSLPDLGSLDLGGLDSSSLFADGSLLNIPYNLFADVAMVAQNDIVIAHELLHTVGAKTGKARTTTLTYARDGDAYLVVASKGGDPKAPGWYHNLKANPNVEINVGPKRFGVTAKPVLPDDPDYARLWQIVNKNNSNRYEAYQEKTSRPIPVVVLKPA